MRKKIQIIFLHVTCQCDVVIIFQAFLIQQILIKFDCNFNGIALRCYLDGRHAGSFECCWHGFEARCSKVACKQSLSNAGLLNRQSTYEALPVPWGHCNETSLNM